MIYVIGIYGLASILLILNLYIGTRFLRKTSSIALTLSAGAHLIYTVMLGIGIKELPVENIPQAVNMIILFVSGFIVLAVLLKDAVSFGAFFAPLATFILSVISGRISTGSGILPYSEFWFRFHTLGVISGEALFMTSAIASIVYIIHQNLIRKGSIHSSASHLPPLVFLDRIIVFTVSCAFVLITSGMIAGGLWASYAGLKLSQFAPKIASGALTWFIMAFAIHQRFALKWRGYRTAVIILAGFVIMAVLTMLIEVLFPGGHGLKVLL